MSNNSSLSLGSPANDAVDDAIKNLVAAGIIVVTASGNGDANGNAVDACTLSPARSPVSITVGALKNDDTAASYSNSGQCVTLLAPGTDVTSVGDGGSKIGTTDEAAAASTGPKVASSVRSGTSFAAPYVTGVIALMLGESDTALSPQDVKARLVNAGASGVCGNTGDGTPNLVVNAMSAQSVGSGAERAGCSAWAVAAALLFLL